MTDSSLSLPKLLKPQSINMTPVPMHRPLVKKVIPKHIMPCPNHHKHENNRTARLILHLLPIRIKSYNAPTDYMEDKKL